MMEVGCACAASRSRGARKSGGTRRRDAIGEPETFNVHARATARSLALRATACIYLTTDPAAPIPKPPAPPVDVIGKLSAQGKTPPMRHGPVSGQPGRICTCVHAPECAFPTRIALIAHVCVSNQENGRRRHTATVRRRRIPTFGRGIRTWGFLVMCRACAARRALPCGGQKRVGGLWCVWQRRTCGGAEQEKARRRWIPPARESSCEVVGEVYSANTYPGVEFRRGGQRKGSVRPGFMGIRTEKERGEKKRVS